VIARPLTLRGEIIATLTFIKLIGRTQKVLAHDRARTRKSFVA